MLGGKNSRRMLLSERRPRVWTSACYKVRHPFEAARNRRHACASSSVTAAAVSLTRGFRRAAVLATSRKQNARTRMKPCGNHD